MAEIRPAMQAVAPGAKPQPNQRYAASSTLGGQARKKRLDGVGGIFQLSQLTLIMLKQKADAAAVGLHSESITTEIVNLAESDENVARIVDSLCKVGPYGALVSAIMPLIIQLGVNHGKVPEIKMEGIFTKAELEEKMKLATDQLAA